jgi:hypothetical protein
MKKFAGFVSLFCILIVSGSVVYAESWGKKDTYQFDLQTYWSRADLDAQRGPEDARLDRYGFAFTAFLNDVLLDGTYPSERAFFYQRESALSVGKQFGDAKGLNRARSAGTLQSIEQESEFVSLFLARKELPVWARMGWSTVDEKYRYAGGTEIKPDRDDVWNATLGVFMMPQLSFYIGYEDDLREAYQFGGQWLIDYNDVRFVELGIELTQLNDEDFNQSGSLSRDEDRAELSFRYYAQPQTSMGFAYQRRWYEDYDEEGGTFTIDVKHYWKDRISLGLFFSESQEDERSKDVFYFPAKSFGASLGLRF